MKKLVSILLAAALVLIGPAALAEAPPEPQKESAPAPAAAFDVAVTDAFSYESADGLTFRVPKIEYAGAGIQAVNDAIWADLYDDQLYSEYGAMTALVQEFETQFGSFPDDEFKEAQRQSNQSEDNTRLVRPYLDETGDLCGVGRVYSLAGAGEYAHELTLLDRGVDAPAVSTADLPETAPADP